LPVLSEKINYRGYRITNHESRTEDDIKIHQIEFSSKDVISN